jgi:hypothetical protein
VSRVAGSGRDPTTWAEPAGPWGPETSGHAETGSAPSASCPLARPKKLGLEGGSLWHICHARVYPQTPNKRYTRVPPPGATCRAFGALACSPQPLNEMRAYPIRETVHHGRADQTMTRIERLNRLWQRADGRRPCSLCGTLAIPRFMRACPKCQTSPLDLWA